MSNTPQTLTVMESNALLDVLLRDTGTYKQKRLSVRNYLMGLLMLDAGLRVGEVVKLHWNQLFFADEPCHGLLVREWQTKSQRQRTIPLSQRIQHATEAAYRRWWSADGLAPSVCAFYRFNAYHPLTTRQVERIIKKAGLAAIGRPVHPHVLRHTFASRLMRTVNARIVQELLGHKDLSSTQIYTHPNHEDLTKAIDTLDRPHL